MFARAAHRGRDTANLEMAEIPHKNTRRMEPGLGLSLHSSLTGSNPCCCLLSMLTTQSPLSAGPRLPLPVAFCAEDLPPSPL